MTKTHAAAHHKIQAIKRSAGRSAVAAAAYRHNTRMTDERTGLVHDFKRKGDLVAEGVIGWTDTPATLWNAAEQSENRKNSITAREIVLALPHELDIKTQERLIRGHCLMMRDRYKVACSYVIHDPENDGNKNTHAHIMITSREVSQAGEFGKKTRILDDRKTGSVEFEHMRAAWAKRANAALEKAGVAERIDHRSHTRRAEAGEAPQQEPQRHMGPRLTAVARKHEAAEAKARSEKKPIPAAPRFFRERKRITRRNAAMWGLWTAATKAKTAANTDGKIRDEGDNTIEDTAALFETAMESGVLAFKLADRRRKKERERQKHARPQRPPEPPKGGGIVQLRTSTQERPQTTPVATPTAQAKQDNLVVLLRKGLAEIDPQPDPAPLETDKAKPVTNEKQGLFGRVLQMFRRTPEPETEAETPPEGPKPWQRVETSTAPPTTTTEAPKQAKEHTPTPEPQSKATDPERAAIIERAARSMLPKDGQACKPPKPREAQPPPVLKPKRERTRSPPQR
jgi:hypothetical protein